LGPRDGEGRAMRQLYPTAKALVDAVKVKQAASATTSASDAVDGSPPGI